MKKKQENIIMKIFKTNLEKRIARKFQEIEIKMKNSFVLIRKDIKEMQNSLDIMKKYFKNHEKQEIYARKKDNKIRQKFRENVDEFTQKIKQLRLAFSRVNELEKTLVVKKNLAQFEDSLKNEFKEPIRDLTNRLKQIENIIKKSKNKDRF